MNRIKSTNDKQTCSLVWHLGDMQGENCLLWVRIRIQFKVYLNLSNLFNILVFLLLGCEMSNEVGCWLRHACVNARRYRVLRHQWRLGNCVCSHVYLSLHQTLPLHKVVSVFTVNCWNSWTCYDKSLVWAVGLH